MLSRDNLSVTVDTSELKPDDLKEAGALYFSIWDASRPNPHALGGTPRAVC